MEQQSPAEPAFEFRLGELWAMLRREWWKILCLSAGLGLVVLLLLLTQPNYYRSRAMVAPTGDETKPGGTIGALATFGIAIGGPSKIEDLEVLFRSLDLAARVFARHPVWADVLGSRFDPSSKMLRPTVLERITGKGPRPPDDWDAIRVSDDNLRIVVTKKAGTLTLTFDALSAEAASQIVAWYLEEAKSRMQDEALARARQNRRFLEEQVAQTSDALARDRLFTLLGQEIEKEMMAQNREQYGFKIIDTPRVPDRKAGPKRAIISGAVTLVSALFLAFLFLSRRRPSRTPAPPSAR